MKIFTQLKSEWIIFLFISLFIFWQFLLSPPFSLADDGYSLTLGKQLFSDISISNWKNTLFEFDIGRFRPVYLLYFSIIFLFFGSNPIGLWLGQTVVLWLTLVFLYKLINLLTKNKQLSFVLSTIWLIMPNVSENIFRAGTAEPRQLLFILLFIYFYFSDHLKNIQKTVSLAILLVLAIGTKETSIILIPFIFYHYVSNKYKKINKFLLFIFTIVGLPLLLFGAFILMKNFFQTGYAVENFSINLMTLFTAFDNVARTFKHYTFLIFFTGFSFSSRVLIAYFNNNHSKIIKNSAIELSLFILIIQSLFFIVAWKFHFERYFYLMWSFIIIVLALEFSDWKRMFLKSEKTFKKLTQNQLFVSSCYFILMLMLSYTLFFKKNLLKFIFLPTESLSVYKQSFDATQISHSIIEKLLKNKTVEEVYLTNDGYEIMYEIGLYASQFKDRNVLVFSPNIELPEQRFEEGYRYVENPISAYYASNNPKKILIGIQRDKNIFGEIDQALNINQNTKFNVVDKDRSWWILKEEN